MAEIIELIAADHLHIMRWQVRLADLRRHRGEPGCAPELAAAWDTLAAVIDLHMAADEAVCGPASTAPGRQAWISPGKPGTRTRTSARSSARRTGIRRDQRYGGPCHRGPGRLDPAPAPRGLRPAGRQPAPRQPRAAGPAWPPVAGLHGRADPQPVPVPAPGNTDLPAPPGSARGYHAAPGRPRLRAASLRLPGLHPRARPGP
jgi:hypothetical protein